MSHIQYEHEGTISMTDFERVKNYYSTFDEQHRLDDAEGKLEYEISLKLLLKYIPQGSRILDLGGGAGKYSIELAKRGYPVTLADLSQKLLLQAKEEVLQNRVPNIEGIDCVNAVDLSIYSSNHFDTVILFGPLYHLLGEKERERCITEVSRILNQRDYYLQVLSPMYQALLALSTGCFMLQIR